MQTYELSDPRPFNVDLYRTGDALFIHVRPGSPELLYRLIRLFTTLISFPLGLILFVSLFRGEFFDALGIIGLLIGGVILLAFSLHLSSQDQVLIRIDENTIHRTLWYWGRGTELFTDRPAKISFYFHEGRWHFTTKEGKGSFLSFRAREHEFRWIREVVEQFEKEVPPNETNPETGAEESSPPCDEYSVDGETAKHILENREFRGRTLRRLPNPSESSCQRQIASSVFPGTLQVLCARCNAIVPADHVLGDDALAHCPTCGFFFEIADLKRHAPPKSSRIELRRGENTLDLHQRPGFFNVPLLLLCVLFSFDLMFAAIYILIRTINPEATLEDIGIVGESAPYAGMSKLLITVHVIFFGLFLWSIFAHRHVEFHRVDLRFRIRWLCFGHAWKVPRSRLKTLRFSFLTRLWRGFQIPYGRRSFYIGAGTLEIPRVVGEINHWLFTHPPGEYRVEDDLLHSEKASFDADSRHDTALSVGGVAENGKEIRWHCGSCGHRMFPEEMNFPEQTADCPDCDRSYDMKTLRHYAVEHMPVKPDFSRFSVQDTEETRRFIFSIFPATRTSKIAEWAIFGLATLFLCIAPIVLVTNFFSAFTTNNPWPFQIAFLFFLPTMGVVILPYLLMFALMYASLYDEQRQKSTSWSTCFTAGYFELTKKFKERSETIRVGAEKIREFRRGGPPRKTAELMLSWPLWGRFPSNLENRGSNRNELVFKDGTLLYLPVFPETKRWRGMNAWLVNEWNSDLLKLLPDSPYPSRRLSDESDEEEHRD